MRITQHPVLDFPEKKEVTFTFEGQEMKGYEGEPIASALHNNGVRVLRHSLKDKRPRGFFCAIGNCSSCYMIVDGEPNTRVCIEELREGMDVKMQNGKGSLPKE